MPERIHKTRRCAQTNRLKRSSEFRLEQNDEQDRYDIKHPVEYEADHVEPHDTAERNKDKDENDTFDELPCSCLPDEEQDRVKQERYEKDICRLTDKIPRTSKEKRAFVKAVDKLVYELKYLTDKCGIGHQSGSFGFLYNFLIIT